MVSCCTISIHTGPSLNEIGSPRYHGPRTVDRRLTRTRHADIVILAFDLTACRPHRHKSSGGNLNIADLVLLWRSPAPPKIPFLCVVITPLNAIRPRVADGDGKCRRALPCRAMRRRGETLQKCHAIAELHRCITQASECREAVV